MDHLTLRILHLEDLPSDAELIERVLRKSGLIYQMLLVDNKLAYIKALNEFLPHIVLSDHALPAFNSREALAILQETKNDIPFILITSTISEEFAVEIIKQGAADYILKDRLQRLPSAVNTALEINRLEKEKQQYIRGVIESESLMKEAEQMASFGSFYVDLINDITKWSDECYRILGYRVGEIQPSFQKFLDAVCPGDLELVKQCIFNTPAGKNALKITYRVCVGGQIKHIYSELAIGTHGQGKLAYVKGFMQDITKIILAEESLHKSETNLQTIFKNTDNGYVLYTPGKQIISFNHQADVFSKDVFGKVLNEGRYATDYFPQERWPALDDYFTKAIRGENTAYETNLTKVDGTAKWYFSRWMGITDDNGSNFGVMLAISDITNRKVAELEREKIADDLIKRNNALEQFAFIVSHNLRAPVANIIGLTEALTTPNGCGQNHGQFMDGLALSARKLDEVVFDLNHILRISQRVNEQKEVVYFQQLVDDIALALNNRVMAEGAIIKTDFKAETSIYTLKSYLYNIFYNLMLNSINFKQPFRNPVIEIKSLNAGRRIALTFKDNGRGINLAKYGKQIFGLYQRFDLSVDGRGMGLCMAKTQTETLGGKISVESEVGTGSVFTVELPV